MRGLRLPTVPPGALVGLVIMTMGSVLLLRNLGILRGPDTWLFWPAVIVVVGLSNVLGSSEGATRLWGLLIAAVGVYLGLDDLGYAPIPFSRIWPAGLIGLGMLFLYRALTRGQDGSRADSVSVLNEFAMFGGVERKVNTQDFRGGQLFAAFGGHDIDLKQASIARSPVVIDATALFGGIEIKVPSEWSVSMEGVAVFGGYGDSTIQPKIEDPAATKRLIVRGFAIFAGVEVKN